MKVYFLEVLEDRVSEFEPRAPLATAIGCKLSAARACARRTTLGDRARFIVSRMARRIARDVRC
jgi:hypothetical protein